MNLSLQFKIKENSRSEATQMNWCASANQMEWKAKAPGFSFMRHGISELQSFLCYS